jgi:hypothetical protein
MNEKIGPDVSAVEEELKRLESEGGLSKAMPAQGSGGNIDVLDGGLSVGQFENADGTCVPTLICSINFAIRLGNDGAINLAEALAAIAGKRVIIKPHMTIPKGPGH